MMKRTWSLTLQRAQVGACGMVGASSNPCVSSLLLRHYSSNGSSSAASGDASSMLQQSSSSQALSPIEDYFYGMQLTEATESSKASSHVAAPPEERIKLHPEIRSVEEQQDRFTISNPAAEGQILDLEAKSDGGAAAAAASAVVGRRGPIAAAYAAGGPTALWKTFYDNASEGTAPVWFEALCRDLYFRKGGGGEVRDEAAQEGGGEDPMRLSDETNPNENTATADPFTWIDFQLYTEDAYQVTPYTFPTTMKEVLGDASDTLAKLCLGDVNTEYVCFAEGYRFPDRRQLPTSVGTEPLRLWVNPLAKTPTVYVQLSPEMPPALWLPVKPTAAAVRRVVAEFASSAITHRDRHHEYFLQRWHRATRQLALQRMPDGPPDVLRMMSYLARDVVFGEVSLREFPNSQEFFLGEYDDPERLVEHFDVCPFLFAMPLMRSVTDVHNPQFVPRIDGPGLSTSVYRCVYSKALIFVNVHLSTEVKLPPQDPDSFQMLWRDVDQLPKSKIPVFARVIWPDNTRMSGGGRLVERFNSAFQTEFASDMPVDACMSMFTVAAWARQRHNFLSVVGMRQRMAEIESAAAAPNRPLLYPGTREIPNPEYSGDERVGMHVQYLAHLGDPDAVQVIERLLDGGASAPVRMGCAKAALEVGDKELFRRIVSTEPPGRMQTYMTKLVRKRKTRDLTDAEPRLLDDQYEFAAPLWTRRGSVDLDSPQGKLAAAQRGLSH